VDEVFDEAELLNVVQGDRDLLAELCTIFLADAPGHMDGIRASIESNDATKLRSTAHALKGSAATLTARRVAASAHELETIGASGNLSSARGVFERLDGNLTELRQRLGSAGIQ
jgi:polar amino acid transport system substrate-binding protein